MDSARKVMESREHQQLSDYLRAWKSSFTASVAEAKECISTTIVRLQKDGYVPNLSIPSSPYPDYHISIFSMGLVSVKVCITSFHFTDTFCKRADHIYLLARFNMRCFGWRAVGGDLQVSMKVIVTSGSMKCCF